MSYPSMYLRNINKKQIRSLFSNLLIPGQDHRWLEPILTAQGTRRSHPGQAPSNRGSLTPTPSLPPTGTMQTHQFTSQARLWAVGGNQSPRKKTHTEVGRMGELHTESGSIWESIFSLLINVIRKGHYSRTYYTVFVSVYCLNLF